MLIKSAEELQAIEQSTREITECFNADTARLTFAIMDKLTEKDERLSDMTVATWLAMKFITTEFLTANFATLNDVPTDPRNLMYYLEQCTAQMSAQYKIQEQKDADL